RLTFELATLPLRKPAPDPEPLIIHQSVLQAIGPNFTYGAHPLRFTGGTALLREKSFGIGLRAQCSLLPTEDPLVLSPQVGEQGWSGIDHVRYLVTQRAI